MKNKPYVKEYDQDGILMNPIVGRYVSPYPNRQERRQKPAKLMNNRSKCSLVVHSGLKYHKRIQKINGKNILHYDLK